MQRLVLTIFVIMQFGRDGVSLFVREVHFQHSEALVLAYMYAVASLPLFFQAVKQPLVDVCIDERMQFEFETLTQ